MLKALFFTLLIGLSAWISSCQGIKEASKKHSPADIVSYESGNQTIQVTYSRPYKKGRLIFGEKSAGALVPYGKKWRTGANEATEISFSADALIQNNSIKAGTYSLYTIPGPKKWIIAFNSRTNYWGATIPGTPFRTRKDVLRIEVPTTRLPATIEQLSFSFRADNENVNLIISWDQIEVSIAIQ